jgi:predicted O-methyltransferase YrrM
MINSIIRLKKFFSKEKLSNDVAIFSLMRFFQADDDGHQANSDGSDLGYGWLHYGLIRQIKPQRVLCVGSRYGYVPAVLAHACKDNGSGKVDFVDAGYGWSDKGGWTGEGYWNTKKGKKCFDFFGLGDHISLFVMKNTQFKEKYSQIKYDYIYIDGDHSLKGVILDFKLFWPMLRKGGFISFHDICVKENKPEGVYGVWKFWSKVKKSLGGIEFNFTNSGLGLIQK